MGVVVHPRPFVRLVAAVSLLALVPPAGAAVPSAERAALVALYNATGGAHWVSRAGWLGGAGTECQWAGVECNTAGTTVTGLDLAENNLVGALPASLKQLTNLRTLRLGLNQISGALPRELGSLPRLEALDLPFNHITGTLPAELGKLASLESLSLGGNQITGGVIPQLGDLKALRYLDLSDNQLSGAIPSQLGSLPELTVLYLGDNQLSGQIPKALGGLSNLLFLDLSMNQLGGPVPPELGNATSLVGLLLSSNRLGGTIPGSFLNLANLEILWLDHNRFAGPVPFELGALPTLDDGGGLDLRFNALATDTEPGLLEDLNLKQAGGNWTNSQSTSAAFDPQVPLSGLADRRTGGFVVWSVPVAAGAPPLVFSTSGGTGNADLYVRFGAPPTAAQFDGLSAGAGNQETVTIGAPQAGTYFVALRAASPYTGVTLRAGGAAGVCVPGPTNLCLSNGRFRVETTWRTKDGRTGSGHAVALSGDTGYFWFFEETNVEAVLKVLDACTVNDRFWVYAGGLTDVRVDLVVTDTLTQTIRTWTNPQGKPFQPIQESAAFATCAATAAVAPAPVEEMRTAPLVESAGDCVPGPTSLCLSGGRFRVEVTWKAPDGKTGAGQAVPLTADTGYFWFFNAENVEMVLKVLNACPLNDHFWVYAGGLTNVETRIVVTDTLRNVEKVYTNPQRTAFRPIQETSAFETCP
ncbi:MAG: leucine-rich repeat domain-containing protein [Thermoanaerobaculia bacterium]